MDTVVNGNHIVMVDVVAITLCWQKLCLEFMADVPTTLCCVADGKPLWQML